MGGQHPDEDAASGASPAVLQEAAPIGAPVREQSRADADAQASASRSPA